MDGFKNFFEAEWSGLMTQRPIPQPSRSTSPLKVQSSTPPWYERLFEPISKLVLAGFPFAAIQTLIDAGKTLLKMGFGGNAWTDPAGAAKGLGQLAIPPIVYTAASALGMPVPGLIALVTSPQFWKAYQGIGRMWNKGGLSGFVQKNETIERFIVRNDPLWLAEVTGLAL